jgi:hypothetical protein
MVPAPVTVAPKPFVKPVSAVSVRPAETLTVPPKSLVSW